MRCSTGWPGAGRRRARPIELELLSALRRHITHAGARALEDDAAVLGWSGNQDLVATHDLLAEGVHFTAGCPPADVGWKLAAVNLSDLAAMAAQPVAALFGLGLGAGRNAEWAKALVDGLHGALSDHGAALVGGDTARLEGPSVLGLTLLGAAPPGLALGRSGGAAGDDLWVSGTIGDAGLGLAMVLGQRAQDPWLVERYRRPQPRLALGRALGTLASAMIDVSDGLLIDAARLAEASRLAASLQTSAFPLSAAARAAGVAPAELASFGDDYELLFAAPPPARSAIAQASAATATPVARIGCLVAGQGLILDGIPAEPRGWLHR